MQSVSVKASDRVLPQEVHGSRETGRPPGRGWRRIAAGGSAILFFTLVGSLAVLEAKTSTLQSRFFADLARQMRFQPGAGPSQAILFPEDGPYDRRLGYVGLPGFIARLQDEGYVIERQARVSDRFAWYFRQSGIAPYRAKSQAGLTLLDRDREPIFASRTPERVFQSFDDVPPIVVKTLLFIENRELLNPTFPRANPAVEWDRLATALADLVVKKTITGGQSPGGSTLATQMEKFRHSPYGRTDSVSEKLRQMISASLRGYLNGRDTTETRRRIVVDYLNATPLAARLGFGEVIGLGDGLWAWFGTDFEEVKASLSAEQRAEADLRRRAAVYRQVLTLLIAQRRPSEYLLSGRDSLQRLVESYLRLLAEAGVIDTALRDAAIAQPVAFSMEMPAAPPNSTPLSWKAAQTLRVRLLTELGVGSFYDLDRLDLTVETTVNREVQEQVTAVLRSLSDPAELEARGLSASRLLDRGDPEKVVYSLLIFERGRDRNYLRVQADNFDGPFDINEGSKLDLGSTAKLRTLASYLDIVAELHGRLSGESDDALEAQARQGDALTRWVAATLAADPTRDLRALLAAAMQRRYSASPYQKFFTGGGLHSFVNFDKADNGRVLSVAEALQNSVNLVFVRLMRDIVSYHVAQIVAEKGDPLDPESPLRPGYLSRFADREGREYMAGFYDRYRGLEGKEILEKVAARARRSAAAQTVVFRSLFPEAPRKELSAFLQQGPRGKAPSARELDELYGAYAKERFSLNDRGYIAKVHPLELWLAAYLVKSPAATSAKVMEAGKTARQDAYTWLFKPKLRRAQDRRIRTLLEEEAFERIAATWQRFGYPFDWLVPSYATSIGSSGDRPAALAELMGIIANGGWRLPVSRFERLHFAEGTPFETVMKLETLVGEQVMHPEVAWTLRQALIDTVEQGTGRRVSGAFVDSDGEALVVGGKTGTGDHRYERFGRNGQVISSKVVNRTATFVFFLGDRHFGTLSAHVAGPAAADYGFTSALPTQLLRSLAPTLQPLLVREPPRVAARPRHDPPSDEALAVRRVEPSCSQARQAGWHCSLKPIVQSAAREDVAVPVQ